MMVVAVSEAPSTTHPPQNPRNPKACSQDGSQINPRRPPLLPSEKDNNGIGINPKRPKKKQVPSRYMSPSPSTSNSSVSSSSTTSRRFPSPIVSRNSTPASNTPALGPKRSVSVDRRRPVASRPLTPDLAPKPGNAREMSAATKLLITSTRSLSVSFQGETFSLPISKTKVAPPTPNLSSVRKCTSERRSSTPVRVKVEREGHQVENSKPIDQHLWAGRTRQANPLSRSLECASQKSKFIGSGNVIRALQQSMIDETRRASFDGRLSLDLGNPELLKTISQDPDGNSVNESSVPSDLTASDTDSVSSGSTSGIQECGAVARGRSGPHGIGGSARFWHETNSRLRRLQDPGSPLSMSPGPKRVVPPKLTKFPSDSLLPLPRTMSSPIQASVRPASPSKVVPSFPLRRMPSPSRVRNAVASTISSNLSETPSVLSFAVDVRRRNTGENCVFDAHLLRLQYNRQLQWRFVNARTAAALLVQKRGAEKKLWNTWITISDLRDTVTKKRHRLHLLRQKLKLASILKGQVTCLEDWAFLDKNHSISLLGAIEALKACTLRLPVVGGAIGDIQSLKDAVASAVDAMQAVASSICLTLSKVTCLEDWAFLDKNHSISLLGAIEALKACTLRLPVVGGAIGDIQSLKDAVASAVDAMQAVASSICLTLSKVTCLEDWAFLDKNHSISLLGAIEALKACTLRLPVVGGAIGDIQSLKDAVASAVDAMQAVASSICLTLSKVNLIGLFCRAYFSLDVIIVVNIVNGMLSA
ncbi:unnamed protein product [Ilex paraguariensis]|uniref:QWRF motif-containing protein 2 n=1 Tax=Ilex paraguariensis TaxID=185542 RepID=A0ABC8UJH1_9AQUA